MSEAEKIRILSLFKFTIVAGDVEVALVKLAEPAELHVGLISPVNLMGVSFVLTPSDKQGQDA